MISIFATYFFVTITMSEALINFLKLFDCSFPKSMSGTKAWFLGTTTWTSVWRRRYTFIHIGQSLKSNWVLWKWRLRKILQKKNQIWTPVCFLLKQKMITIITIETYLDQDEPLLKNVGDMLEANGLCLVIDYASWWPWQWRWWLDHNDTSKPSHRLTNGPEPLKTIESDGSNIKKPS